MASVYKKPWPNDKSKADWGGRAKIGERWVSISLRMPWTRGSKKTAKARVNQLQAEIDAGSFSDSTREWLGPKAVAKIVSLMDAAQGQDGTAKPLTWEQGKAAHLAAKADRDTKRAVPDKLHSPDRVKQKRRYCVTWFVNWATANQVPFGKAKPFTKTLIDYLEYRRQQPGRKTPRMEPRTIITDYRYLIQFGDFLHAKGICEKPDRDRIKGHLPDDPGKVVNLPEWHVEVDLLETLYQRRRETKGWWATWGLYVVVRGLGCRPSEAASLSWATVDVERGHVFFLDTKEKAMHQKGDRKVPVLYEWVREALVELREDFLHRSREKPDIPQAVCLTSWGQQFRDETTIAMRVDKTLKQLGKEKSCLLKQAQKCAISQMLYDGFPATAVALWTGHTEKTLRRHYIKDDAYLPSEHDREYGRFAKLSDYGLKCLTYASRTLANPLQ